MAISKLGPGTRHTAYKQIKGWFSKNILLKIAAIALAAFLWFHSATNRIQQEEYSVPITVVLEDTSLVDINREYGSATVLLEGQGKEFIKLLWQKPRLVFALTEKKPRKFELSITPQDMIIPEGVLLRPIAVLGPQSVEVELDWLTEKIVSVLPMVKLADEGFIQKGKVTVEPAEVKLRGARKELKGLKSIPTVLVELPTASGEFELAANLDLGGFSTVLTVDEVVLIKGEIERLIERKMEEIPVEITGNMRKDYRARPETINIIVTGMESRVASLSQQEVRVLLEINSPPSGETYYSPKIVLPESIELISEQPKLFQAVPADSIIDSTREAGSP
jgi:hypothetical protein